MSTKLDEAYLEHCRLALRQRTEERAEAIAKRLQRAHAGADAAACVLRQTFGATEVYLFGSAADGMAFDESSDIDLPSQA